MCLVIIGCLFLYKCHNHFSCLDKPEFKFKHSSANYREPISYKDLDLYNTQPIAILRQHFFPQSMVPYSNTGDASLTYRYLLMALTKINIKNIYIYINDICIVIFLLNK